MEALETEQTNVVDLYEMILTSALTSIIEVAYPYILAEREKNTTDKGKVIVMCPEFEDHELGARMVADYFLLEGFAAIFIGARTPVSTVIKAIELVKSKYLCISVTNYYNLISVKKTTDRIKNAIDYDLIFLLYSFFIQNDESWLERFSTIME